VFCFIGVSVNMGKCSFFISMPCLSFVNISCFSFVTPVFEFTRGRPNMLQHSFITVCSHIQCHVQSSNTTSKINRFSDGPIARFFSPPPPFHIGRSVCPQITMGMYPDTGRKSKLNSLVILHTKCVVSGLVKNITC